LDIFKLYWIWFFLSVLPMRIQAAYFLTARIICYKFSM
jgi:hypothetical protein